MDNAKAYNKDVLVKQVSRVESIDTDVENTFTDKIQNSIDILNDVKTDIK